MDRKLELYLQTLESELSDLRKEQRAAEMQEMRQHLEALVSRLEESGLSREEALEAALAQFGPARRIGGELCRASAQVESRGRVAGAVVAAAATYIGSGVFVAPKLFQIALDVGWYGAAWIPAMLGFVAIFAAGIVSSSVAPHRGGRATLWAFGSVFTIIYTMFLIPRGWPSIVAYIALAATMFALWAGTCVGARRAKKQREIQA